MIPETPLETSRFLRKIARKIPYSTPTDVPLKAVRENAFSIALRAMTALLRVEPDFAVRDTKTEP